LKSVVKKSFTPAAMARNERQMQLTGLTCPAGKVHASTRIALRSENKR
jgi:hypothetical protein